MSNSVDDNLFDCDDDDDRLPAEDPVEELMRRSSSIVATLTALRRGYMPPAEWLLPGLLPQRGVAVMYGRSGEGKSFLATTFALVIATGATILGHKIDGGPVVYVAAESFDDLRRRAAATAAAMRADDAPVAILPGPVDLRSLDQISTLAAACIEWAERVAGAGESPRIVVVDTLTTAIGDGDQDRGADMALLMSGAHELANRLGCLVMLVHHAGHEGRRPRGSSLLIDRADALLLVERNGPMESGRIAVTIRKQRNAPAGDVIEFATLAVPVSFGAAETAAIVLDGGQLKLPVELPNEGAIVPAVPKAPGPRDRILELIDKPLSPAELRRRVADAGIFATDRADTVKRSLNRILRALRDSGAVEIEDGCIQRRYVARDDRDRVNPGP